MVTGSGATVMQSEALKGLIARKDWAALREAIQHWPPPEIADLLEGLDKVDRALLFRALPRRLSAEVFAYMSPREEDSLLKDLTDEETRRLLSGLRPDDRTLLFEELPGQATQKLLNLLDPEELKEARQLLGYPEESIGRLMTPDYVAVRPEWTIAQALEHIRQKGADSETINDIYVTDDSWRLIWVIGVYRGGFELGAVVALTMVLVVVVGSLIGVSLPFLLDRFEFDPATASGPLITSLSDIAGVLIYFSIATRLLGL